MLSLYALGIGLILCFSFVWGIFLLYRRRWVSGGITVGLPVLVIVSIIGFFQWAFYESDPSAVEITVQEEGDHFVIHGEWNTRLEPYQFGTDFLVFYTPGDEPIEPIEYNKGDWQPNYWNFSEGIQEVVQDSAPPDRKAQLFDIKAEEEFRFRFRVSGGIALNQIQIRYVHVHSAPMSSLGFWTKEVQ